jgi:hypothetical protein
VAALDPPNVPGLNFADENLSLMNNEKSSDNFILVTITIFCLSLGVGVYFAQSGTKVPAKGKPQIMKADDPKLMNTVLYGPYNLTQDGRIYQFDVRCKALPDSNSSRWCQFTLLNAKKEPVGQFGYDFWAEKGKDDEGHWRESDTKISQRVVLDGAGEYYLAASGSEPVGTGAKKEISSNKKLGQPPPTFHFTPTSFEVIVWKDCYDPGTLWWVAGVAFVLAGLSVVGRLAVEQQ